MTAIKVDHITLKYEQELVLNDISLSIEAGESVALLGPNGVGKSSLIDVIISAIKPDFGTVKVFGQHFQKIKSRVGVLFDTPPLFPLLKVDEIIKYFGIIYGVKYPENAVKKLEIDTFKDKLFGVLSKGQKKKAGIILTTMHNPDLLILDEPTSELDPFMREEAWKLFKENKRTILFTSHLWEEAARYADRVAFLYNGRIVGLDTTENLLSDKYIPTDRKLVIAKKKKLAPIIEQYLYYEEGDQYHIFPDDIQAFFDGLTFMPSNYSIMDKELRDVYVYLTKGKKTTVNENA